MQESKNLNQVYHGRTIAKNTLFNLFGYGIPLVFALILIPPLIRNLGDERYGILNLAWIIIGYFSFFDFGLGKGLTKIIAEKIGLNRTEEIPRLFWTSLFLMLVISIVIMIGVVFLIPTLITKFFNISQNFQHESLRTFYALAFSIPIVATTVALRGVLEAYQKFGFTNLVRIFLGISTFLTPLIVFILTQSLFWIVVVMIFIRVIVWMMYFWYCLQVNKNIKNEFQIDFKAIKPILKFSIWITLSNIIGPIILYSDRFLIGALISASAITYYATPYEMVTKLLLISGALTGVLFPIFSTSFFNDHTISKNILLKGIKFIFLVLYPIVLLLVTFAFEMMKLWLGYKFAINSSQILQFLAIGILMNSLSSIPNNYFQGVGKPKIPTLINLVELPFYLLLMWFAIETNGIKGAASAYLFAAIIDTAVMYIFANKIFAVNFDSRLSLFSFCVMMIGLLVPFFINDIYLKVIYATGLLLGFLIMAWVFFLTKNEKFFFISKLRMKMIM